MSVATVWTSCRSLFGRARFWIVVLFSSLALLIVYYALSNTYTPFTSDAYVQAFVIQVAPRVAGQVETVDVQENQQVKKGDVLFSIDSRPYSHKVKQLEASRAQMKQLVAQMESELAAAKADDAKIAADEEFAEAVFQQESAIFKKDATTERKFLDAQQKRLALKALRERARATIRQKEEALAARIGGEHALVAEVEAQLATARLELEWTTVRAPVNGLVTDLQLQPGAFVKPGQAALTCIDSDSWWIVANFRENNLELIEPGQPATIALKTYPGRVLDATVSAVGWGVAQGQGVPSGVLPGVKNPPEWIPPAQRFQVRLTLDDQPKLPLRVGATGSVTVFTSPNHLFLNALAETWQWLSAYINYLR